MQRTVFDGTPTHYPRHGNISLLVQEFQDLNFIPNLFILESGGGVTWFEKTNHGFWASIAKFDDEAEVE